MKVHLHIDRLVLDGIAIERTHASKVRAAVEHELTRLMAVGGLASQLTSGGAVPRLSGGNIRFQKSTNARVLGRDIARALHQAIGVSGGSGKRR
jgi:hypothetical protein